MFKILCIRPTGCLLRMNAGINACAGGACLKLICKAAGMILALIAAVSPAAGAVKYVDAGLATGLHDGSSWANAYSNLAAALSGTGAGTDLWVAAGVYFPGPNGTDIFSLKAGVNLYGGFTNGMAGFNERDWQAHQTILDGGGTNYHVVYCAQTITLDGFIIRNGRTGGSSAQLNGGGMYIAAASPTIRNCVFSNNLAIGGADTRGGALFMEGGGSPWIDSCSFVCNSNLSTGTWMGGGAVAIASASPTMTNCVFAENYSAKSGGGIYSYLANATIVDCVFRKNAAGNYGGAIGHYRQGMPSYSIKNCFFIENTTTANGGAIGHTGQGKFLIEDCVFAGNTANGTGGALIINDYDPGDGSTGLVVNCVFSGNRGNSYGVLSFGIYPPGTGLVQNCRFAGNSAVYGAVCLLQAATSTVRNCEIAGNFSSTWGGGLRLYISDNIMIENCTIFANRTEGDGGGISAGTSGMKLANSIVWSNTCAGQGNNIDNDAVSGASVSHVCLEGGIAGQTGPALIDGGGNITNHPLINGGAASGSWTQPASYDPANGWTVLTDSSQNYGINQLAGMIIKPDLNNSTPTNRYLQFCVHTNDANNIIVWGNCAAMATNGAAYQVWDLRPAKSSPCVDSGTNRAWMASSTDLDGRSRLDRFVKRVDMGSREFVPHGCMYFIK